jgi:Flp pilus assembly protein TadB
VAVVAIIVFMCNWVLINMVIIVIVLIIVLMVVMVLSIAEDKYDEKPKNNFDQNLNQI